MLELFRSPRRAIVWFMEASLLAILGLSATGMMLGWARALGGGTIVRVILVAGVAQASMYYHGLYGPQPVRTAALVAGLVRALGLAGAVVAVVCYFFVPLPAA